MVPVIFSPKVRAISRAAKSSIIIKEIIVERLINPILYLISIRSHNTSILSGLVLSLLDIIG